MVTVMMEDGTVVVYVTVPKNDNIRILHDTQPAAQYGRTK